MAKSTEYSHKIAMEEKQAEREKAAVLASKADEKRRTKQAEEKAERVKAKVAEANRKLEELTKSPKVKKRRR